MSQKNILFRMKVFTLWNEICVFAHIVDVFLNRVPCRNDEGFQSYCGLQLDSAMN
jgi:hypothetical protein